MFVKVTAKNFTYPVYLNRHHIVGFRRIDGKALSKDETPYTYIWDAYGDSWRVEETPEQLMETKA